MNNSQSHQKLGESGLEEMQEQREMEQLEP